MQSALFCAMRVLVVEDDPEVRDFLLRVLREAAWAADSASTGQRALDQLASAPYDLVILDVGLPDIDGFAVCSALRARGDRTPVLVLTARNAVNDRVRGLDAGADDYLAKPFAVSELLARLRALARRPAETLEPVLRWRADCVNQPRVFVAGVSHAQSTTDLESHANS